MRRQNSLIRTCQPLHGRPTVRCRLGTVLVGASVVTVTTMAGRIVSLLTSATEIVYALGLQDRLDGVSDECDVPAAARDKPVVVRARQPRGLSQRDIDTWVRAEVAGPGLYDLDEAALARLHPDIVLTQDLCRVCAVPTGDVSTALDRLGCPATVVTLDPQTLEDVLASIVQVAAAAGVAERGTAVCAGLRGRLSDVAAAVSAFRPHPALVLEWLDPPFTAGHWVPDVVRAAGGIPLLADPARPAGRRSVETTWAAVRTALDAHPDALVILAPCGVDPREAWRQVGSVPAGVIGPDTVTAELARPGPRLVDAVEAVAAALHPAARLPGRPDVLVRRPPAGG
jgi:iron complex transport system substrate-binding protein